MIKKLHRRILQGDVLKCIKKLPDNSIDCIITSPPYWAMRDYAHKQQIGLEPDFRDYVDKLVQVMEGLKPKLKNSGSIWVNLNDTYGKSGKGAGSAKGKSVFSFKTKPKTVNEVTQKSLTGIPQRFFIACIDKGWIARNYCIWHKPNPLPASVTDRLNNVYEPLMFFTKAKKYYFDLDPIRIPSKDPSLPKRLNRHGKQETLEGKVIPAYSAKRKARLTNATVEGTTLRNRNFSPILGYRKSMNISGQTPSGLSIGGHGLKADDTPINHPKGKNPGDTILIPVKPDNTSHIAIFPLDLPLYIISCACPKNGLVFDPFMGSGTTAEAAELSLSLIHI